MKETLVLKIFEILDEYIPNPQTDLEYTNPYTLLVAVVLSAQSTDAGVNKATRNLFQIIDTPQKMVELGEETLKSYIKTIGLYNAKAKNIIALSHLLIEKHNSFIPKTREELEALPGVGRKTANVVLNVCFQMPTIPVDTHILRVSQRLGLSRGSTPLKVELDLEKCVPDHYKIKAHHLLILHGRYTCKARKPECEKCPLTNYCEYFQKNIKS